MIPDLQRDDGRIMVLQRYDLQAVGEPDLFEVQALRLRLPRLVSRPRAGADGEQGAKRRDRCSVTGCYWWIQSPLRVCFG